MRRHALVAVAVGLALGPILPWSSVSAHPLGNFSVNHAHALTIRPDGVVDEAVVDIAEIPTAQQRDAVDVDGDGAITEPELERYADQQCTALRDALTLTIDGAVARFDTTEVSYSRPEGQAGLETGRLECTFVAPLTIDSSTTTSIALTDAFQDDRVGWHEITAVGDGLRLVDSPVPSTSPTNGLRDYPTDLLASPLDVREVVLAVTAGAAAPAPTSAADTRAGGTPLLEGGPLADAVGRIGDAFDRLVGRRDLTLGVGLLAVLLAMILGASHAVLPGHGKTVMAAYLAGRQGSTRDAVLVGATVTATHTGGVLLLGLALSLSASLAGEDVIGWLGVVSGVVIGLLGAGLLWSAARSRPGALGAHGHGHSGHHHHHHHHRGGHRHGHEHGLHDHDDHDDRLDRLDHGDHGHDHSRLHPVTVPIVRDRVRAVASGSMLVALDPGRPSQRMQTLGVLEPTASPTRSVARRDARTTAIPRRHLVGMGIAGGLVPSPSALVVLLSAIALGRTAFGVVLVLGYGLGMAATLTLAGLLLIRVRDRFQRSSGTGRWSGLGTRWLRLAPVATAGLVMVVGIGLALRSFARM